MSSGLIQRKIWGTHDRKMALADLLDGVRSVGAVKRCEVGTGGLPGDPSQNISSCRMRARSNADPARDLEYPQGHR
jgi:hypothetical protein